ncbi:MAG TPA: SDR family oxidoreductase [Acidimicrobiia bacterium]|nr:SDR family oxidoreductase [Acidimicrobiia bacterium]
MRLQDKVVVITGAGHGLGRDAARLFASEGAKVVATDIVDTHVKTVADEIQTSGGEATYAKADVTSPEDNEAAVKAAVDAFGRLDVMYCNAGIPEVGFGSNSFVDTPLDDFNKVVAVNLTGVFLGAQSAARQFLRQGDGGNIVVTTSAASLVAYPGFRSYVAAKHGANGLVKALACELGAYGIRVNALCPFHGMSANFAGAATDDPLEKSYEEAAGGWDKSAAPMPLKLDRPPNMRDAANLALFLASDESAYMSGVCIPATDGATYAKVALPIGG